MGTEVSIVDQCLMGLVWFGYNHTMASLLIIAVIIIACIKIGNKRDRGN